MMNHVKRLLLPLAFIGVSVLYTFARNPAAAIAGFEENTTQGAGTTGAEGGVDTNSLLAQIQSLTARKAQLASAAVSSVAQSRATSGSTMKKPGIKPSIAPPQDDPAPAPVNLPPPPANGYKDGTYTGSIVDATYGNVQVKAVVTGGKLVDVAFLQHPTTPANSIVVNNMAMPKLTQEAIVANGAQVATVSGATFTSNAFMQSLAAALSAAGSTAPAPTPAPTPAPEPTPVLPPPPVNVPAAPANGYADGTYTGSAVDAGYGPIQIQATVAGGKITNVVFLQHPTSPANSLIVNSMAMPLLTQEAIAAQSAQVATVSGATFTSGAFQQSLAAALAQAGGTTPPSVVQLPPPPTPDPVPPPPVVPPAPASGYTDGTYTGSVYQAGSRGPVQVQAVITGGKITSVSFLQHPTAAATSVSIFNGASSILIQEAITAQSASVATVSGATLDSNAFMQSLASALSQAGTGPSTSPTPTPAPPPATTPPPPTRHHNDDN